MWLGDYVIIMTWFLTTLETFFWLLLFLTLTPRDHVTYCQVRGLSGHTSPRDECVCFNLEDFVPPKAEEDYLPFSWSESKWAHLVHCEEIFDFELELLRACTTHRQEAVYKSLKSDVQTARETNRTTHR